MPLLKNNKLSSDNNQIFNKIENDKKKYIKTRLYTFKAQNFTKSYHPLKQKKIKLHKLKFVNNTEIYKEYSKNRNNFYNNLKRQKCNTSYCENWSTIDEVVKWLISIGIQIKRTSMNTFILENKVCFLNSVIVFANKKRTEAGLVPFYIAELTEF